MKNCEKKNYVKHEDVKFDYKKPAIKFFSKHEDVREEFEDSIMKIVNNDHPEQVNYKNLQGRLKGYSRIAIGGYRVIYKLIGDLIIIVEVAHAGSRGDIYKTFRG